jgi:hypothetical protein
MPLLSQNWRLFRIAALESIQIPAAAPCQGQLCGDRISAYGDTRRQVLRGGVVVRRPPIACRKSGPLGRRVLESES